MRTFPNFVLALICVIGVAACSSGNAEANAPEVQAAVTSSPQSMQPIAINSKQSTHIIEIHKMKFQTKSLDVKIGDTVTWINKDLVPHTATALDKSWDSGRLKKDESFTLTITNQTALDYFCFYHRQMKAKLTLKASG